MQARQLPARQGALWFFAGFHLFRRNPPLLTAITVAYLFGALLLLSTPLIGPMLLPLALPVLTLMVANACRALDTGQPLNKVIVFEGIAANRLGLIRLGSYRLIGAVITLALAHLIEGDTKDLPTLEQIDPLELLGIFSRRLLIEAPVLIAFWFAPLITGWNGVPALKSLFFSWIAWWRNWRAFVVYGLTIAVFAFGVPLLITVTFGLLFPGALKILAVALSMVLFFIGAPIVTASNYLSYRDVFRGVDEHA